MKKKLLVAILPVLEMADRNITDANYLEDQGCVVVFYKGGGMKRVSVPRDGIWMLKDLINGLTKEDKDGVKG